MKKQEFETLTVPCLVKRIISKNNATEETPNYIEGKEFKVIEKSNKSYRLKDENGNWHFYLYVNLTEKQTLF